MRQGRLNSSMQCTPGRMWQQRWRQLRQQMRRLTACRSARGGSAAGGSSSRLSWASPTARRRSQLQPQQRQPHSAGTELAVRGRQRRGPARGEAMLVGGCLSVQILRAQMLPVLQQTFS